MRRAAIGRHKPERWSACRAIRYIFSATIDRFDLTILGGGDRGHLVGIRHPVRGSLRGEMADVLSVGDPAFQPAPRIRDL
jgi:hypothetical protein